MSEASRGEKSSKGKGTESTGKAGAGDGDANILPAEAFTHGGIRKTKFEPKVPTRRLKKLSAVKREQGDGDDGELPDELQRLIKRSQEDAAGFRRRQDHKAPVRVAFGFGSTTAGRAAAGSAGFSKGRARSGGGGAVSGGGSGVASRRNSNFVISDDDQHVEPKSVKKKIPLESLDYTKYYPVTLPLRRPRSGVAELLDEEEFGEGHEYVEAAIPAAQELGLLEESAVDKFIFFQLPSVLPVDIFPTTEGENGSSEIRKPVGSPTSLETLPEGFLGKLLIYESGAVKLKLGDVIFDAMPGTNCVFSQELAAVNAVAKHCLFLGDVNQRVVLTPDIDRLLSKGVDVS